MFGLLWLCGFVSGLGYGLLTSGCVCGFGLFWWFGLRFDDFGHAGFGWVGCFGLGLLLGVIVGVCGFLFSLDCILRVFIVGFFTL